MATRKINHMEIKFFLKSLLESDFQDTKKALCIETTTAFVISPV